MQTSPCAPAKKQSVNLTITDCFLLLSELFDQICFENGNSTKVFPLFFPLLGDNRWFSMEFDGV